MLAGSGMAGFASRIRPPGGVTPGLAPV
ncbi:MAG: hypothetical protein AB8B70_07595, partial [Prochlorococcus sp.]